MTEVVDRASAPESAVAGPGGQFRRLTPAAISGIAVLASIPARMLSERLSDPDVWWHMRTGGLIARLHRIPKQDVYSYTVTGRRWVPQEWGSELILHGLRDAFGLYGILFWRAGMLLAIYALVAWLLIRRMGFSLATWVLIALTAYAGSSNWTERPNLFSFLFIVVLLHLIDRRSTSIWWAVPIAAVWANLHGMVIMGIGLLGLVTISEALKARLSLPGGDATWAKRLALVTVASLGATFINPWGPGLLIHALQLVRTVGNVVTEWFSPNFHEASSILFLVLLLITIAALTLSKPRVDVTDLALTLAFTVLALQAARNLAVAAIVLGYVAARYLPSGQTTARTNAAAPSPVLGGVAVAVTLGALGMVAAAGFPRSDRPADIIDRSYPIAAIEALDAGYREGVRLLTQDAWAGLIIDRSWPKIHLFYDTRVDLYGSERAIQYARTIAAYPDWDRVLDRSCTTHVLVRPREPLARVLALNDEWAKEREDAISVTFARVEPALNCGLPVQGGTTTG